MIVKVANHSKANALSRAQSGKMIAGITKFCLSLISEECVSIFFFSHSIISRFRLVSSKRSTEMHASRETCKTRETRKIRDTQGAPKVQHLQ